MVRKALEWIEAHGFDFVVTGEVVGQRPMSQRKDTMPVVARKSGAEDLLVRPLSGLNLPPTLPERKGWIRRDALLGFNGRSRKPQMALAAQFGFRDYAQPAGGCCFLTDAQYSVKLADLWHNRGRRDYELDDIMLLKVGRHLRPSPKFKLIIAREEGEARFLQGYRKQFLTLTTVSHPGPLALIDGRADAEDVEFAARIVARFGKGRTAERVTIESSDHGAEPRRLQVVPLPAEQIPEGWYL